MRQPDTIRVRLRRGHLADEAPPRGPRLGGRGSPRGRRGHPGWRGPYIPGPQHGAASQQVIVKTEPYKAGQHGMRSYAVATRQHLGYLTREGKDLAQHPMLYTTPGREAHIAAFASRTTGDPHQFRLVLSPEHGQALDMPAFTQRFMAQLAQDVGRPLDWVAVTHYDTLHPHSHIVLRGRDLDGEPFGLKPHYLERGMVYRGQDIATEMLGRRQDRVQEREVVRELAQEVARAR